MTCPLQSRENADVLLDYCGRKLNPEASAELERHIESCADCQSFANGQRLVWETLDAWDAAPLSMDFDRRLYGKIEERGMARWWATALERFRGSFKPAAALAAVCLTVVALTLMDQPRGSVVLSSATQAAESIEIEQVETTLEDMEMLRQLEVLARQDVTPGESAAPHTL